MVIIPLSATPAQTFTAVLGGQYCAITVRQKGPRLYLDLDVGGRRAVSGAVCVCGADIIQSPTPEFLGSLHFYDVTGREAPQWWDLDSRFFLAYCEEGEDLPEELRW